MLIKCLSPEKLKLAMLNVISEELGEKFLSPPAFDLSNVHKDSTNSTPIIFVLSPGTDPLDTL